MKTKYLVILVEERSCVQVETAESELQAVHLANQLLKERVLNVGVTEEEFKALRHHFLVEGWAEGIDFLTAHKREGWSNLESVPIDVYVRSILV